MGCTHGTRALGELKKAILEGKGERVRGTEASPASSLSLCLQNEIHWLAEGSSSKAGVEGVGGGGLWLYQFCC